MATFHRIFGALTGLLVAILLVVSAAAFVVPPRRSGSSDRLVATEQTVQPASRPAVAEATGTMPGQPG